MAWRRLLAPRRLVAGVGVLVAGSLVAPFRFDADESAVWAKWDALRLRGLAWLGVDLPTPLVRRLTWALESGHCHMLHGQVRDHIVELATADPKKGDKWGPLLNALCMDDHHVCERVLESGGAAAYLNTVIGAWRARLHPLLLEQAFVRRHMRLDHPEIDRKGVRSAALARASGEGELEDGCLIPLLLSMTESRDDDEPEVGLDLSVVKDIFDDWENNEDARGTPVHDVEDLIRLIDVYHQKDSSRVHYHSIRALATLAGVESNRQRILESDGVPFLYALCLSHLNEHRVRLHTARALANLACSLRAAEDIIVSGFVPLLVEWATQTQKLGLRSQAMRALQNLRAAASGSPRFLGDHILPLFPPLPVQLDNTARPGPKPRQCTVWDWLAPPPPRPRCIDVVVIHGILGHPLKTWRLHEPGTDEEIAAAADVVAPKQGQKRVIWPADWLPYDLDPSARVRVFSVGYRTFLSLWDGAERPRVQRSHQIQHKLEQAAGLTGAFNDVVFLTHSMGGLLCKQLLVDAPHIASRTRAIVFFGTPHFGVGFAHWANYVKLWFFPTKELMELQNGSPALERLHGDFLATAHDNRIDVLSFGETKKTPLPWPSILIVPEETANPGIGEFVVVEKNHFNVCKPRDRQDAIYTRTVRFLQNTLKDDAAA